MTAASRDTLAAMVRRLFEPATPGPPRVGLEVEVLPFRSANRGRAATPAPAADDSEGAGTLAPLRRLASARGWTEVDAPYGVPRFLLPGGAALSYEPGGQLEYSSAPHHSLGALDDAVRTTVGSIAGEMERAGINIVARGIDPHTPLSAAPFVLHGERYRRQREHYDRKGPAGRAMMLQTAGIHVNVDVGDSAPDSWQAANALAPLLTAMFANSPARAGTDDAKRSHRAAAWRVLDRSRTAVFAASSGEPATAYLDFALGAESFLLGEPGAEPRSFDAWLRGGATTDDFAAHLTTLFPEVRPRGYLEIRSVDALPDRWCIVPAAVAVATLHHAPTRESFLRRVAPPSLARLERAARAGLGDADLAAESRWLTTQVPGALRALGGDVAPGHIVERVEEFLATYTLQARDPGHDPDGRAAR